MIKRVIDAVLRAWHRTTFRMRHGPAQAPDFILFHDGIEAVLAHAVAVPLLRRFSRAQLFDLLMSGRIYREDRYLLPAVRGAMADFIGFNEGQQVAVASGWPDPTKFDLSTNAVSDFTAATAYASRAPITGTSYAQSSKARPSATGLGVLAYAQSSWSTGSETNWTSPKSIVASNGTDKIFCAWNLVAGGAARDMSQANTTLQVTPTYSPTNPA